MDKQENNTAAAHHSRSNFVIGREEIHDFMIAIHATRIDDIFYSRVNREVSNLLNEECMVDFGNHFGIREIFEKKEAPLGFQCRRTNKKVSFKKEKKHPKEVKGDNKTKRPYRSLHSSPHRALGVKHEGGNDFPQNRRGRREENELNATGENTIDKKNVFGKNFYRGKKAFKNQVKSLQKDRIDTSDNSFRKGFKAHASEEARGLYDWKKQARKNQREPEGDWLTWLIMAGRGFGKTRTGAETIRKWVEKGWCQRIALVGNTVADVRDVMIEGESGILNISPPSSRPRYYSGLGKLEWPNGAVGYIYTAEAPEKIRGAQFDGAWIDELAKFRNPSAIWTQLLFCLRLGKRPRVIVTTTPRPLPFLKELQDKNNTVLTRGSSYDNRDNLSPVFFDSVLGLYEGTRLGQQEIYGDLLLDTPGALWTREMIVHEKLNVGLKKVYVAVDPAVTSHKKSDETGIVVVGLGEDDRAYVLDDRSGRYGPQEWCKRVLDLYEEFEANGVVVEVNQGGDFITHTLKVHNPSLPIFSVRATRGKYLRAEPVAALYEQQRVLHTRVFPKLEEQMTSFVQGMDLKEGGYETSGVISKTVSPDRLDALVWGITYLCLENQNRPKRKAWCA